MKTPTDPKPPGAVDLGRTYGIGHEMKFMLHKDWAFGPAIYADTEGYPGASMDYFQGKLQVLVENFYGDPLVKVRFNDDGQVVDIVVDDDLMRLVRRESDPNDSEWEKERNEQGEKENK